MISTDRCAGCGKVIDADSYTATVTTENKGAGKVWGKFHKPCFDRAVDSPAATLARIKRLAKKAVEVPAKKNG